MVSHYSFPMYIKLILGVGSPVRLGRTVAPSSTLRGGPEKYLWARGMPATAERLPATCLPAIYAFCRLTANRATRRVEM